MHDKSLALSLVRAHLLDNPSYLSWVSSYTIVKWCKQKKKVDCIRVGGHYRRKALYAKLLASLQATCKLQEFAFPNATTIAPPVKAFKERWDKDGSIISIRRRQLQWC